MRAHRLQSYVLAILMLCAGASSLTAQTADPNTERGITPGKAYAAGEPDTINLFNGNLNLTIPIGQSYHVGGDFSYGLALNYGGNSWEHGTRIYETWFPGQSESGYRTFTYSWSFPSRRSNAGLGWMLTLGKLYSKYGCGFAGGCFTAYESPDGALHGLVTPTLHDLDANEHPYPNQSAPTVYYSRDGTYLRYRKDNPEGLELDFPDGTVTIFDWYTGLPTRRYDPHGNWLKVFYDDVNNPYCDPSTPHCASTWHLQDSQGRNHYVYFRPVASYYEFTSPAQPGQTPQSALVSHEAVAEVRLQTFGSTTSSYYFHYEGENFGAWPSIARQSIPGAGLDSAVGCTTPATLLTSVVLPDATQSTYSMNYITTGPNGCLGTGWRDSGNIQKLTLPTGGRIEWTYQQYAFNNPAIVEDFNLGASGVATRTIFDAANTPISLTKYEPTLNREAGTPPPESQTVVTVSSGDGTETFSKKIHYFSTCVNTRGGGQCAYPTGEYGLPFTRVPRSGNPDSSGNRFLSTVELTRDASGGWNGPQRKFYIRYEADAPLTSSKVLDRNRRPVSQRSVYEDNKIADEDWSVFDGLGHFRQHTTGGNFGRADSRTLFTNHNPTVGTFSIVNGAVSGFTMIPVSSRWLLSTFTYSTVTETLPGSSTPTTSATQYCFDSTTGYLKRTRLIKAPASGPNPSSLPLGSTDVLSVFTPNSNGNTIREQYLGGDNGPAPSVSDTCGSTISSEAYRIEHTFQSGSMATAQYYDQNGQPLSFKMLDADIDANTGLVKTSRDRGDIYNNYLNTDFTYDALGRLTDVKPMPGISGTWTHFDYTMNPPRVDTYHRQHGATSGYLAHTFTQFDVLGRVWRESRTMPDGSNAVRETLYNGAGWKASVSEAEATPTHKTYFVYDTFGRPTKVTAPDNSVVTLSYNGVTSMTKTVGVRTGGDATNISISDSSTTESYDRQGRLWKVTDPWSIVTEYTYDIGDRLTQVCMNKQGTLCAQIRSFNYDNRGFLSSETQPEKGQFGNGTTQYFDYDARGHATRRLDGVTNGKFDLLYEYDRAERLKRIGYRSGRPLKVFTYGTDNDVVNGDWRNGKLTRALRYNWMDAVSYGVQVSEDYTYAGKDGRVSKRNTTDFECLVTPTTPCTDYGTGQISRSFTQTFGYDDLGQTTSFGYPACTFMGCQSVAPAAPAVSNTYTNGFLTSVNWTGSPRASTISYWPNGLVNQVAHGNFVGVDHPGRAFLALTVYYRNEGTIKDELSQSLIELVDKDMLKRARILGAAFRAAHMVSASMPGVLTNTPIGYEGNRLVWTLPEPYSNLEGERVDRRFKVLADLLDRDAEIRVRPSFQLAAS